MSTTLKRRSLTVLGMVLLAAFLGVTFNRASAANPAPVMVFHLTEPEDDMLDAMNVINSAANSPMVTKVSIAISANNTLVYYDHWEDGFADDIANPTPSEIYSAGNLDGVQIWGNGLAADGCAPQIGSTIITCTNANDVLNKGNVIILDDDTIVVPNLSSTIDWDGKDKIGGSNAIAVTRSLWASGSNSLFAWANAMYPTTEWGQEYTTPVGCDTISAAADMFEYSAFTITAAYDGTVIQTDPEGDGTWEANVTLNEGQTYFESTSTGGACSYVKQGGKVRSNDPAKPIQVVLVTGDIAGSPGYGSRDLNLSPDAQLSSSYWVPVGNSTGNGVDSQTPGTVRLYIYNPEATTMYVRCEKPSTATVYTIAADTVNTSFTLANDQAGHCFAVTGAASTTPDTSRKFTGVAAVDNDGTIWDWGVPFVPENRLSNQALVGLGAGRDWTSNTNLTQNGSPVWVTPTCQTWFYVDWNNDGTPDKVDFNGDNDVTDTNVNGLNETTSNNGFQVTTLQSVRMYDASDLDQTGAYVFTKTAANNGGSGGCNFAAAWGEDPRVASAASPGLDAGTIIVSLRSVEVSKDSERLIDADNSGTLTPGDTLRYIITVENTGLASVPVTVEDTVPANTTYVLNSTQKDVGSGWVAIPDAGAPTPFPLDNGGVALGSLPVGDTWQVRFSVTVNSLPAGQTVDITNCAEISYDASLVETCKVNTVTVPAAPALTLDKTTSTAYYNAAGNTISYSYLLTNTGNVPLTPAYAVSDNKATVTCPQTLNPLPVGQSITCTATYVVTPADVTAGQVVNIATATAQYNSNTVTSNQDTVTVPLAALNVVKSSTTTLITAVGQIVPYTFTVTNTGNVALTGVTVSDPKCTSAISAPTGDTNSNNKLDLTETWVYTCTHTVTQAEMDAGGNLDNTVTADSNETGPDTDDLSIPIQQTPGLNVEKSSTTTLITAVGQIVPYTFTVTNTGNVALTGVTVSDPKCTSAISAPTGDTNSNNKLDLTETWVYTCTHTVTQAEMDAGGNLDNTVTADSNETGPDTDDLSIPIQRTAAINVEKSSTTTLITAAGQPVDYTFVVTNGDHVTLTNITVTDPKCDLPPAYVSGDANNDGKLQVTETWTYTCIHTVTQAEMDAGGNLLNTVTADSAETDPATDDLSIPIQQNPGLNVEKSSTTQLITHAGQPVVYTFDVTNTGNISLTGVTVSDPKCDAGSLTGPTGDTNNDGKLGLLETWTFTCTHTVTQAELDAATGPNPQLHNVVTADSNETGPDTDPLDIPIQYNPGLNVVKSSTTALITAAGQQVDYQFTVTNSGNVTLTNVIVSDAKCDATPVLQPGGDANNDGKMQVTETWVFTCTHTVTQAEMNAGGMLHNVATADSTETPPDTDDLDIPIEQRPALTLDKDTTTVNYDSVGDTIAYTYKVTNSGNVSLTPPYAVTDNKIGAPNVVTCQQTPNPLNPGAFFTCTATYTVTQADLDAGSVTNLASGSAMHGQTPVISNNDEVTVPAIQTPLLEVTKTPNKTVVASGDLVTFTILVENKGTITLSLNSLTDSVYGDITTTGHNGITATTCDVTPPVTLAALTGTYTCTFTAAVTGNANTTHTNTVTACDTTKNPDVCDDGSADVRIIPDPAIEVVKTANPTQLYTPGGPVVFTIVVNNTGGGALDLTSLTDNVFGNITTTGHNGITATTCAVPQSISQGGSYQCQFTATVNGPAGTIHTDIVTGSGTGFNGDALTDNDDAVVNIIAIPVVNTCPANQATHQWTDILGVGMGTTTSHKLQAKLVIPNSANLVALYGQLAGKQQGGVKYVRFTYPNNQYVQVQPATSPAPRTWGVFWYGTELNPSANIRGRWFLQTSGAKTHVPRAFILYPTYNNPNQQYINVFEVINTADSQVYWNIAEGWIPSRQLMIDIPAPMARATFNVEVAVVDNDKDARPVYVTVSAGGVAQTQSPINPNKGNLLNILSFTLANVPAGTGEIVVTITSPQPYTNGLGALGGDSAAITGVTANYLCEDVQVIP